MARASVSQLRKSYSIIQSFTACEDFLEKFRLLLNSSREKKLANDPFESNIFNAK
jgi:hypothetical protein